MVDASPGLAPVFVGWNVWTVYEADDLDESLLGTIWHAGISHDQLLKLWVENQVEDNASGANVSDPLNPDASKFRGDQVQIVDVPAGMKYAASRQSIPELAGSLQVGKQGSGATLRAVRFYNRGQSTAMPWPHDQNFVVDAVLAQDPTSKLFNAPAPSTFGGGLDKAGKTLEHAIETAAWVIGGGLFLFALTKLVRK